MSPSDTIGLDEFITQYFSGNLRNRIIRYTEAVYNKNNNLLYTGKRGNSFLSISSYYKGEDGVYCHHDTRSVRVYIIGEGYITKFYRDHFVELL